MIKKEKNLLFIKWLEAGSWKLEAVDTSGLPTSDFPLPNYIRNNLSRNK
jgi:hypothetical protein